MKIAKQYMSDAAELLISKDELAAQAYKEVQFSILNNITSGSDHFILNCTQKNCNGVVPIKDKCYQILEEQLGWYREKPLIYFSKDAQKGGPIDVYKEFVDVSRILRVGLEFETGNISSAHRSMNKLRIGIEKGELDLAMLMMPIKEMAFYLTDRISNYEELEPYFFLQDEVPFLVFGFDAEEYSKLVQPLPKGKDGMSPRTIRKWKINNDI